MVGGMGIFLYLSYLRVCLSISFHLRPVWIPTQIVLFYDTTTAYV